MLNKKICGYVEYVGLCQVLCSAGFAVVCIFMHCCVPVWWGLCMFLCVYAFCMHVYAFLWWCGGCQINVGVLCVCVGLVLCVEFCFCCFLLLVCWGVVVWCALFFYS